MKLIFWLEELSAQAMLENLIPRLFMHETIPEKLVIEYHYFQGKSDLEKNIQRKIVHYRIPQDYKIAHLILRDQDAGDCYTIKQNLLTLLPANYHINIKVRIACRELETFYLADLSAVSKGLNIPNLPQLQNNRIYRNPDSKSSPSDLLDKLSKGKYQKVSGSREIGRYLDIYNTRSNSFYQLVIGIKDLLIHVGIPLTDLLELQKN